MLTGALHREEGVTLLELLIGLVLASLLGAAIVGALGQGTRGAQRNQDRITALAELQTAAQRMSRELRAANPITAADEDTVTVTVRRNNQTISFAYRLAPEAGTNPVTYRLEEVRTIGATATTFVLARGLQATSLELEYADSGGTTVQVPVASGNLVLIRTIRVTLSRFIPTSTTPMTLETTVELRNQA